MGLFTVLRNLRYISHSLTLTYVTPVHVRARQRLYRTTVWGGEGGWHGLPRAEAARGQAARARAPRARRAGPGGRTQTDTDHTHTHAAQGRVGPREPREPRRSREAARVRPRLPGVRARDRDARRTSGEAGPGPVRCTVPRSVARASAAPPLPPSVRVPRLRSRSAPTNGHSEVRTALALAFLSLRGFEV